MIVGGSMEMLSGWIKDIEASIRDQSVLIRQALIHRLCRALPGRRQMMNKLFHSYVIFFSIQRSFA